ncbi:MAG TPA: pseudouridine synthase, partial [Solirubrobacteraceae bacterium]|nr:pseudouridine synthase [Solirubrobacteraceae bacterium]
MRLQKYLAHAGVASRRAAEEIIRDGRVTVGGETVMDPARDVDESSDVRVDERPVRGAESRVVYAIHKPAGVVSTAKDTHGRPTVVDMLPKAGVRLYPVGRLDADSTGLLLLTNDGDLADRLTHPRNEVPKTYRVHVRGGMVPERKLAQLRSGVTLDDGKTAPAQVRQLEAGLLEVTIHEGRKHQVKRMLEAVGHEVTDLHRIRFGPLGLGELRPGAARQLSASEVERLRRAGSRPKRESKPVGSHPNRGG